MKSSLQNGNRIDVAFLRQKFPELARLEKRGFGWNDIGNTLALLTRRSGTRQQAHAAKSWTKSGTGDDWSAARNALQELLCTGSPELAEIRNRLKDSPPGTTPLLLSTLSLWLAGHLGKSVTLTTPLVATVLLGIARDGMDGWCTAVETASA